MAPTTTDAQPAVPAPITEESLAAAEQEIGPLRRGSTDPDDPVFDSLARWDEQDGIVTI